MKIATLGIAVAAVLFIGTGVTLADFGWYSESTRAFATSSDPFEFATAIRENNLQVTFTNTSNRPVRILSHVAAERENHYDPITLLVISPDMKTHTFEFVNERDRSVGVYEMIEAGESYSLSIDLQAWNESGANSFHFEDDTEYVVLVLYEWSSYTRQPPDGKYIHASYTSDAMKISFTDGQVNELP